MQLQEGMPRKVQHPFPSDMKPEYMQEAPPHPRLVAGGRFLLGVDDGEFSTDAAPGLWGSPYPRVYRKLAVLVVSGFLCRSQPENFLVAFTQLPARPKSGKRGEAQRRESRGVAVPIAIAAA